MKKSSSIFVAGHKGLLGSAIVHTLQTNGFDNIMLLDKSDVDLSDPTVVNDFIHKSRPEVIFNCAGKVGGIKANIDDPIGFFEDNILINMNILRAAHNQNIKNVVMFGSNCMYPVLAEQPLKETSLFQGPIEYTNLTYGMAKLSTLSLVDAYQKKYKRPYFYIIPASLYGPNDQFDPTKSHVCAAMLSKFHQAKTQDKIELEFWGTGSARRELLYVDDAVEGVLQILDNYNPFLGPINLGTGYDVTIKHLAELTKKITNFEGTITFNNDPKLDGNLSKILDSSKIEALGFKPKNTLEEGLFKTYEWFKTAQKIRGFKC